VHAPAEISGLKSLSTGEKLPRLGLGPPTFSAAYAPEREEEDDSDKGETEQKPQCKEVDRGEHG
jgi:hypothetical protein